MVSVRAFVCERACVCPLRPPGELSAARLVATTFFLDGRMLRPLPLIVNGTAASTTAAATAVPRSGFSGVEGARAALTFDAVMGTGWKLLSRDRALVAITAVRRAAPAHVSCMLNLTEYGFEDGAKGMLPVPLCRAAWDTVPRGTLCACVCVCLCVRASVRAVRAVRVSVCASAHVCMRACVFVRTHARACVYASVGARRGVWISGRSLRL